MLTGRDELSKPEKSARGLPVHGADRGHHGGQREPLGAIRFDASCTNLLHHRLRSDQIMVKMLAVRIELNGNYA